MNEGHRELQGMTRKQENKIRTKLGKMDRYSIHSKQTSNHTKYYAGFWREKRENVRTSKFKIQPSVDEVRHKRAELATELNLCWREGGNDGTILSNHMEDDSVAIGGMGVLPR